MGSFVILKEECGVEVIETCLYSERGVGGQGGDRGKVEVVAQTRLGCSMEDSGVRESELVGADHRLGAGGRSQLRHDPRDMGLDRRLRHVQTGRDLLVRSPPAELLENITFPGGQLIVQVRLLGSMPCIAADHSE